MTNVFHHCVAVFIAIRQARENEKSWIGHKYYASRNIVWRSTGSVKRKTDARHSIQSSVVVARP